MTASRSSDAPAGRAPTFAAPAIAKLMKLAPELGLDPARLAAQAGFDPALLADRDARLPMPVLHAMWSLVVEGSGQRALPLALATRFAPGDYGLVGFVCANSETLEGGLAQLVRYFRLWTDEPRLRLEGGALSLAYSTAFADAVGVRCATEATFAEIVNGIRRLIGPFDPASVSFAHAAPADPRPYREYFGAPVRFDAGASALTFTEAQRALALPTADPRLVELLRPLAEDALSRLGPAESLRARLASLLAERMKQGLPTAHEAAAALHISERTLRRRLDDEGTTFSALLDETRADLACAYLRDRRLPMAEVAFLVGFSEPSAFHRAFKRWKQVTPATYRAAHARR